MRFSNTDKKIWQLRKMEYKYDRIARIVKKDREYVKQRFKMITHKLNNTKEAKAQKIHFNNLRKIINSLNKMSKIKGDSNV